MGTVRSIIKRALSLHVEKNKHSFRDSIRALISRGIVYLLAYKLVTIEFPVYECQKFPTTCLCDEFIFRKTVESLISV